MFIFEEPFDSNNDWYLGDHHTGKLTKEVLKTISNAQMLGVQFLYDNFAKEAKFQRGGAILNQDEELNMPLQVSAFLSSVKEKINDESPVLIISSVYSLCKWHYHITKAGFEPRIISSDNFNCSSVYLLSSDSLKLAEKLLDFNLFCVVIDDFDVLATKLLVKKLRGYFNIGLTKRNFYENPDQKLKWLMLNWAVPGCVGKLNDFYRIDNLHSLSFADNYRFWWMRLTWKFCDSFEPPSEDDLEEYHQKLQSWSNLHNIEIYGKAKQGTKRNKNGNQPAKRKKIDDEMLQVKDVDLSNNIPNEVKMEIPDDIEESYENRDIEEVNEASNNLVKNFITDQSKEEKDVDLFDFNLTKVKSEVAAIPTEMECDEDEPILSIIYSKMPHRTEDDLSYCNEFPKSLENKSKSLSILDNDKESAIKSQTYLQLSNILDNLSDDEHDIEIHSEESSFFSDLISNNK
ncbi:uncharacterized protein LOC123681769 isoform X3 [Harmonia axyridis]|uniref:uncharacterized protein LOC123681769 isoform X3 n=1 Tax=Harmonia axyridis TaxID=115357 RepID=UPI001E2753E2|nr:uncharacterized protein LOC123681769 isoform X3 [Harmonia axyridis]